MKKKENTFDDYKKKNLQNMSNEKKKISSPNFLNSNFIKSKIVNSFEIKAPNVQLLKELRKILILFPKSVKNILILLF